MESSDLEVDLLNEVQAENQAYRRIGRIIGVLSIICVLSFLATHIIESQLGRSSPYRSVTGLLAGITFLGGSLLVVTKVPGTARHASMAVIFGGVTLLLSELFLDLNLLFPEGDWRKISDWSLYIGVIILVWCINPALFEMAMRRVQLTRATEKLLHAREKQRISESSYEAVFQNASEGIIIFSGTGILVGANESACAILGKPLEVLRGKELGELFGSDLVRLPVERTAEPHVLLDITYTLDDGKKQFLQLNLSHFPEGGYVVFVRDVTQKQALEEQVNAYQRLESIGRLAGGVAHDFNNMLTPVIGFSDMLLMQAEPDHPWRKYLEHIHKAADHARVLTRQLLAFGRRQQLDIHTVSVNEIIRNLELVLRRAIRESVELTVNPAPDIGYIRADVNQIEQILMNLCTNAEQAMPGGGRLIIETSNTVLDDAYVRRHPSVAPGPYVMISVSDTGVGMDAQTLAQVFEPFFTTKEQGTGLGLATVYGIVKQHGGSIWMYSEPGKGTTCRVYFPQTDADTETASEQAPAAVAQEAHTVLVVEDEPAVLEYVTSVLQFHGYDVIGTTDPVGCATLLANTSKAVELLVTDIIMPKMNGRELYEHLLAEYPHLKVIYMSGYAADVITHHHVLEPNIPVMQKPIPVRTLLDTVGRVFAKQA